MGEWDLFYLESNLGVGIMELMEYSWDINGLMKCRLRVGYSWD